MGNPVFLLISACSSTSTELIKGLLNDNEKTCLRDGSSEQNIHHGSIPINNKYYSAEVDIFDTLLNENVVPLLKRTDAIAISFDSSLANCLDHFKQCDNFLTEHNCDPELKFLVCSNFSKSENSTNKTRDHVYQWAVKKQYEVIELNPHEEDIDEDGIYGLAQIQIALHSNQWSNMVMESPVSQSKPQLNETLSERVSEPKQEEDSPKEPTSEGKEESGLLSSVLESDDNMEVLFQRFSDLKCQAQNLSFEERRKFAEDVTMQFWKAIGGSDDELDGLDD